MNHVFFARFDLTFTFLNYYIRGIPTLGFGIPHWVLGSHIGFWDPTFTVPSVNVDAAVQMAHSSYPHGASKRVRVP